MALKSLFEAMLVVWMVPTPMARWLNPSVLPPLIFYVLISLGFISIFQENKISIKINDQK